MWLEEPMAPTVLRRMPLEAQLLDRTGIVSASKPRSADPAQTTPGRDADSADSADIADVADIEEASEPGVSPEDNGFVGAPRVPRSSIASVASVVLMIAVAVSVGVDLPAEQEPHANLVDRTAPTQSTQHAQPPQSQGSPEPGPHEPAPKTTTPKPKPPVVLVKPKVEAEVPAAADPPVHAVEAPAHEPLVTDRATTKIRERLPDLDEQRVLGGISRMALSLMTPTSRHHEPTPRHDRDRVPGLPDPGRWDGNPANGEWLDEMTSLSQLGAEIRRCDGYHS